MASTNQKPWPCADCHVMTQPGGGRCRGLCSACCQRRRHAGLSLPKRVPPPTLEDRFWSFVDKLPGNDACWIWTGGRHPDGYGSLWLNGRRCIGAHRVSWLIHNGSQGDRSVLHKCNNPPCVRPDHLYLGTPQDNTNDKLRAGRQPKGEAISRARLNAAAVHEIRRRYVVESTIDLTALASDFGVSLTAVSWVVSGRTWKHVITQWDDAAKAKLAGAGRGERNGRAVLTEEQVRGAREMRAGGATIRMIATAFGVSMATAQRTSGGRGWRHVK